MPISCHGLRALRHGLVRGQMPTYIPRLRTLWPTAEVYSAETDPHGLQVERGSG